MPATDVLFLPGMLCDPRLWAAQAAALPQTAHFADTTRDDTIAAMAATALAGAPPRFALAGLSMGGILAFEIWRQAPERVSHLAILDSNPYADTPERRSLRLEQIEIAVSGGLRELAVESLKPLYLAERNRTNETLLGLILDMALDLGPEVFRRQSLAVRDRADSTGTLTTIDCPTLILCGREDALCPPDFHRFMAEHIPGARLRILDDCGHLASLEQPDLVTSELDRLFAL